MGIDWVTFFAQIINLAVLVWLLKKFLYHPIIAAVDKRQARILSRVKEADELAEKSKVEYNNYLKQTADFENTKQALLAKLTDEIQQTKTLELEKLKSEMTQKRDAAIQKLLKDEENMNLRVRTVIGESIAEAAQKLMRDFADLTPVDGTVRLFIQKTTSLDKNVLKKAIETATLQKTITVVVSKKISASTEQTLKDFIRKQFHLTEKQKIQTVVDPDLILGISLKIGDLVFDWNIESYFDDFNIKLKNMIQGIGE